MKFNYKKYRNLIFSALAVAASAAMIKYSMTQIDDAVYVSASQSDDNSQIIVLDSGHGGMDGGCSTADGIPEKGINLSIMLSLRDMCRLYGYDVVCTRESDVSIYDSGVTGIRNQKISDMENRLELFNRYPDAVCLSIHQNNYTDPKYSGAQMFYSGANSESERFAAIIQSAFVQNLQPDNTRETKLCGDELYLCYYCDNPAVMAECGFLSNPDEAAKLTDESYQQSVAFTLFTGINTFLNERK
ncbi:MAG: N-acetylmuramoyl-L-alanine amidase [Oscillospiraceae bacterium]|nr:N-acetylmuramoyl-L-alanine amidase [Oscillospiraceae bacterium]